MSDPGSHLKGHPETSESENDPEATRWIVILHGKSSNDPSTVNSWVTSLQEAMWRPLCRLQSACTCLIIPVRMPQLLSRTDSHNANGFPQSGVRSVMKAMVGVFLLIMLTFSSLAITGEEVAQDVYLLVRDRELLAFSASRNRWVSLDLRSGEKVIDSAYGGYVAVALTNLRVLGFSAVTSQWAEEKLMVGESIVTVEAEGRVGAVITNLRAFGFSAREGRWTERRFRLK